jgi:8-amino-7-oxononanoate synthase
LDLFTKCQKFVKAKELMANGFYPYFRPIEDSHATEVWIQGRKMVMVGSNNYLGLTHHPHVIERVKMAAEKYGSGCTGSRFLNGTLDLHEELESRLAKFMNREAVQTFSTGLQTNLGVIATLVGKNDVIFCDRENHASILDGCRLSFGETRKFRHNDPADLERLLAAAEDECGKLIVVDGVFSMLGDVANLPEIVRLAKRYGARILVDDAHSIGVLGRNGRGTAEHFGLDADVDLVMGTFSKSFASIGGFIAGPKSVIHYLRHHSRPLIFSASIPPSAAAAALAALDVIEAEPERRERLWSIQRRMKSRFDELGFDTGKTETPIIPLVIGDEMKTIAFCQALFESGIFANPVIAPGVPPGKDLIRTSYMATHTEDELVFVSEVLEKLGRRFEII